jgi:hypothetical protein
MRRREFIQTGGGASAMWPFVARAQQPPTLVIGFLSTGAFVAISLVVGSPLR